MDSEDEDTEEYTEHFEEDASSSTADVEEHVELYTDYGSASIIGMTDIEELYTDYGSASIAYMDDTDELYIDTCSTSMDDMVEHHHEDDIDPTMSTADAPTYPYLANGATYEDRGPPRWHHHIKDIIWSIKSVPNMIAIDTLLQAPLGAATNMPSRMSHHLGMARTVIDSHHLMIVVDHHHLMVYIDIHPHMIFDDTAQDMVMRQEDENLDMKTFLIRRLLPLAPPPQWPLPRHMPMDSDATSASNKATFHGNVPISYVSAKKLYFDELNAQVSKMPPLEDDLGGDGVEHGEHGILPSPMEAHGVEMVEHGNFPSTTEAHGDEQVEPTPICLIDELVPIPCEHESHLAHLSESDSELSDFHPICEFECFHLEDMSDTQSELREVDDRSMEDIAFANTLTSPSLVSSYVALGSTEDEFPLMEKMYMVHEDDDISPCLLQDGRVDHMDPPTSTTPTSHESAFKGADVDKDQERRNPHGAWKKEEEEGKKRRRKMKKRREEQAAQSRGRSDRATDRTGRRRARPNPPSHHQQPNSLPCLSASRSARKFPGRRPSASRAPHPVLLLRSPITHAAPAPGRTARSAAAHHRAASARCAATKHSTRGHQAQPARAPAYLERPPLAGPRTPPRISSSPRRIHNHAQLPGLGRLDFPSNPSFRSITAKLQRAQQHHMRVNAQSNLQNQLTQPPAAIRPHSSPGSLLRCRHAHAQQRIARPGLDPSPPAQANSSAHAPAGQRPLLPCRAPSSPLISHRAAKRSPTPRPIAPLALLPAAHRARPFLPQQQRRADRPHDGRLKPERNRAAHRIPRKISSDQSKTGRQPGGCSDIDDAIDMEMRDSTICEMSDSTICEMSESTIHELECLHLEDMSDAPSSMDDETPIMEKMYMVHEDDDITPCLLLEDEHGGHIEPTSSTTPTSYERDYKGTYMGVDDAMIPLVDMKIDECMHDLDDTNAMPHQEVNKKREKEDLAPIDTWEEMQEVMHTRFVPTHHKRDLFNKLTQLKQSYKSVEEYYKEMHMTMMSANVDEREEQTMARFLNGLNIPVKRIVEFLPYKNMVELLHQATRAERQVREDLASAKTKTFFAARNAMNASSSIKNTSALASKDPPKQARSAIKTTSFKPEQSTMSSKASTGSSNITCFKCGAQGHKSFECKNTRVMITRDDGDVEYLSEGEYEALVQAATSHEDDALEDQEQVLCVHDASPSLVVTKVLTTHALPNEDQRCNIFQTRAGINGKSIKVIIDGGSCHNLASTELCTKLNLPLRKHPHPYHVQWLSDNGNVKIQHTVTISFKIGAYEDTIDCDVVPMTVCHMLLGRPWQYDKKANHDGYTNAYSFKVNDKTYILRPMTPSQVIADNAKALARAKEATITSELRGERVIHQKESERQKPYVSEMKSVLLATKSEMREVHHNPSTTLHYVLICKGPSEETNDLTNIPSSLLSLLKEFQDVFPDELPHGLPPLRGIEHRIDLIPGAPLPNRAAYRTNPEDTKEIQRQIQDLLAKGEIVRLHGVPRSIVSDRDVKFMSYLWKTLMAKFNVKLLFSSSSHPQTDGQTEVVNRSLSTLLRVLVKKNLKAWEDCIPHAEFAYNRAKHSTTMRSPFMVVYGFEPPTAIDLLPLPLHEQVNMDIDKRAQYMKKLHEDTRTTIEQQVLRQATRLNLKKKARIFNEGDLVWIHLRKDRFPQERNSKLKPRGDGPFKVLKRINDNAYVVDIPTSKYLVSNTFNVSDLSPYHGDEENIESRTTLSQGGEMIRGGLWTPPPQDRQALLVVQ
ncbi:hypothetical protein QYE76_027103 [Lolium multiflorum]|uniref:Uncharacterized protein n=1 Tax=Lolium multiflorum TaxID=4521 RepID=A0AAD8VE94_LOLMU|nr:hypothetical protein QYE76_027103 [Lolium multiflorum]